MNTIYLILYILAAVCFLLGWLGFRAPDARPLVWASWHWVALGLFFWVLVPLIMQAKSM